MSDADTQRLIQILRESRDQIIVKRRNTRLRARARQLRHEIQEGRYDR